jgi:dTDP-glucose 4,6-dehydratase/UDP-glucose 4-epimerase
VFDFNWSPECIEQISALCSTHTIDVVINATGSADVAKSVKLPVYDFEANVMFHFKLMDIIKHSNCKYIYFSSAAVYGNPQKMPIAEGDGINPVSPYGWHKYYGEQMCREFASLYKVQTASLRLFSVFGPGQKKMLFYDLYNKCIANTPTVELQGSGNDSRDFIFVSDVVLAVEKILATAPMHGECYNVGSGTERLIKDVATQFVAIAAPEKAINFNGHAIPGYPSNWRADMTKMNEMGFFAETEFLDGIKETIQWLKENV